MCVCVLVCTSIYTSTYVYVYRFSVRSYLHPLGSSFQSLTQEIECLGTAIAKARADMDGFSEKGLPLSGFMRVPGPGRIQNVDLSSGCIVYTVGGLECRVGGSIF